MKRLVETIRVKGVGTPPLQRAGPAWKVVFSPSEDQVQLPRRAD